MSKLAVLDLFSGIGGWSLGLERTGGFRTEAFCEIDPYCRRVLAKHWPEIPCYDDVRTLDRARLDADGIRVDVIAAGFPCQDISLAGSGAGIEGSRSGLWREIARLAGELRPRYVLLENVAALLGRGMGRVLGDMAAIGYSSCWHCIPASAVGAPHRRDRVWIIAWRNDYASCQILRRNSRLRQLWDGICSESGCGKEGGSREILLDQMQRRGALHAFDGGCCGLGAALRDGEADDAGNRGDAWEHLEACQSGSEECGRDPASGARGQGAQEITGLRDDSAGDDRPENRAWGSGSSSQYGLEGQQAGKSCRCVEAQALRTSQAIGNHLSATLHGRADYIRLPEWISDYPSAPGDDELDADESIPAAALGAPHRRDRVWIVAYPGGESERHCGNPWLESGGSGSRQSDAGSVAPVPDANRDHGGSGRPGRPAPGSARQHEPERTMGHADSAGLAFRQGIRSHHVAEFASTFGADWWAVEPNVGRMADGVPNRVDRLRALGNSLVPAIPELIGRALLEQEGAA